MKTKTCKPFLGIDRRQQLKTKNMTVRQKMDSILQNDPDYKDCGEYQIDGRAHGVLQNTKNGKIKLVYKSKDDIDDDGNPITKEMEYENLKEMLEDYKLVY